MRIVILNSESVFSKRLLRILKPLKHEVIPLSIKSDINLTSLSNTQKILKNLMPEAIYNFAYFGGGLHSASEFPADLLHKNVQVNLNLYKSVSNVCLNTKIINVLANCSYPGSSNLQTESEWFNGPVHESTYAFGNAKRMQYVISYCYEKQYGIKTINYIIPNHFGPDDSLNPKEVHAISGMVIRMIKAKRQNLSTFEIWGSGKPVREWIYVDDLVKILKKTLTLKKNLINPVNIAQNKGYKISESAKIIAKAVGFDGKLVFNTQFIDGATKKILNNEKFKEFFPNFIFTDHRKGIYETVKYYDSVL